jgi:predicted DNA-binding transcriptional regulator AlpA
MTTEYLGIKQVSERLGVANAASYDLPEPDVTIGCTRGWLPETIDRWNAQRPGRGVGGGRPRKNKAE